MCTPVYTYICMHACMHVHMFNICTHIRFNTYVTHVTPMLKHQGYKIGPHKSTRLKSHFNHMTRRAQGNRFDIAHLASAPLRGGDRASGGELEVQSEPPTPSLLHGQESQPAMPNGLQDIRLDVSGVPESHQLEAGKFT